VALGAAPGRPIAIFDRIQTIDLKKEKSLRPASLSRMQSRHRGRADDMLTARGSLYRDKGTRSHPFEATFRCVALRSDNLSPDFGA
jgi:hypothetical protein